MKKILFFASALAGLFLAASCQRESLEPEVSCNVVSYTIQVPGALSTKVIGENVSAVNELVYEVYRTEATAADDYTQTETKLFQKTAVIKDGTATVDFELVNNQNFRVLFWAHVNTQENPSVYTTTDLKNVTLSQSLTANAENYAAFAGSDFIKYGDNINGRTVTLVRPIAQLNIATAPGSLDLEGQTTVKMTTTGVTVTGLSSSYNVAQALAGDVATTPFTYTAAAVSGLSEQKLSVNGTAYDYVAMNYVGFAEQSGSNVEVSYTINTENVGTISNTIKNVPVKANYRTNIVGNLITSMSDYTITLDAEWGETEYVGPEFVEQPAYDADTKTWTVTNADELAWVAASVNGTIGLQTKAGAAPKTFKGETVVLANDIDLQGAEWTPIGVDGTNFFVGTFDGKDHTISNYKVTEKAGHAGLFGYARATIKNLKVKNVTIKANHYAGAIVGQGYVYMDECHAENVNITVSVDPEVIQTDGTKGDYGDKAGGLIGQNCEGGLKITNSSAKNVVIEGYRDLGGIVGMAHNSNVVTDNSVENITIIQNLENGYKTTVPTTLGAVIGRRGSNINESNNTETDPIIIKTAIAPGVYPIAKDTEGNVTEYGVYSAEGLEWVAAEVTKNDGFAGKTITLTEDIDLFKGYMPDGDPVTTPPIGDKKGNENNQNIAFKGTFDGAGHSIKNLYQNGWALNYEWGVYGSIGLFRELEGATVKNVVLEGMDACIEGGDISFIAGSATGDCTFENIEIKNSSIGTYNNGCGGIIGWSGAGNYTFKNIKIGSDVVLGGLWGSFDSSIGGIVGQAEPGATYNFENVEINCRIDAYNDCTASYDYYNYRMCGMIIGRCEETTTINGTNYPDLSKYNLSFNNVVVNYGDWMNYHYCDPTPGYNNGRGMRVEPGYAYDGLPEDFDHSQCTTNHMAWIPFDQLIGGAQLGVKGLREVNNVTVNYPESYYRELGYKANGNTYTVFSGEGFRKVATEVLDDKDKNVTIELANDIDLKDVEWPAVSPKAEFVLDGNNFSIKNLKANQMEDHGFYSFAMFTSTRKPATIKNLVIENAVVNGNGMANSHGAVLVACNYDSLAIEGVTVKNSTVNNCDRSSAIVTYLYFKDASVKDCVVEACTVNSIGTAGALLGMNNNNNFEATRNTIKSTTISSSEGNNKAGILIGTWQSGGTLNQSDNVIEESKAINAGTETNNNIGRQV